MLIRSIKKNFVFILMCITAVVLAITGILYNQSFLKILPLYVSLLVNLLQSRVNRYAPLVISLNAALYAIAYYSFKTYAMAAYALFISGPLHMITFFRWRKRPFGESTIFRKLTNKQRLLIAGGFISCWLILYAVLSSLNSSYRLLDNTSTLFGIMITILTMFPFIEYTWLMLPHSIATLLLYLQMIPENPAQITYFVFQIYSTICQCIAFCNARRLYQLQQSTSANAVK